MNFEYTECGTVSDETSVAQLVKKFPTTYGAFIFKSVSQKQGNGPYSQPDKSLSQHTAVFTVHYLTFPVHKYIFRFTFSYIISDENFV